MVKIEYNWHTDAGTKPAVFYATSVDSFHREKQQDGYVFGKDYTINTITHTSESEMGSIYWRLVKGEFNEEAE